MAYQTKLEQIVDALKQVTLEAHEPGNAILIDEAKQFKGPFYAITALTDCVIDADQCVTNILEKDTGAATKALATDINVIQGMTLYGNFESIELSSGSAIAYTRKGITVTVEA